MKDLLEFGRQQFLENLGLKNVVNKQNLPNKYLLLYAWSSLSNKKNQRSLVFIEIPFNPFPYI